MNNRRVIFWLLTVTVFAAALNVFFALRAPSSSSLRNDSLLDPAAEIAAISIRRPSAPEMVLEKRGRWMLARPYSGNVDEEVVLRLLDAFSFARPSEVVSEAELIKLGRAKEDIGLGEPRLTISFTDAERRNVTFSFGELTPSTNGVYAAMDGSDAVLVLPREVVDSADLDADAFRERDIFPFEPDFITGFELKVGDGRRLELVCADDQWKVDGAIASSSNVRRFLGRLAEVNAVDFVWPVGATNEAASASAALLSGYGLDADSALTLNLHCMDGVDRRILLGRDLENSRSYALVHNGAAVVTIDSALKSAALEGLTAFVDLRLFPLDAASVPSYTVIDGETACVVVRTGSDTWRLDSPNVLPVAPEVAETVLGRILTLMPDDLAEDGVKVTVGTNHPTRVVARERVFGSGRMEDFRPAEILKVDPESVKRLVVTPAGEGSDALSVSVVYSREQRRWNVEAEELENNQSVDESAVRRLLSALSPLQADAIVTLKGSAADFSLYGLETPHYTVAVDRDGLSRFNLLIGAKAKGGRYATIGTSESIFVLSEKVVRKLTANLIEE